MADNLTNLLKTEENTLIKKSSRGNIRFLYSPIRDVFLEETIKNIQANPKVHYDFNFGTRIDTQHEFIGFNFDILKEIPMSVVICDPLYIA